MGKELEKDANLITIEIHADKAKTAEENIKRAEIPPTLEARAVMQLRSYRS
jgi:predicted O-methyltransferase YrrM